MVFSVCLDEVHGLNQVKIRPELPVFIPLTVFFRFPYHMYMYVHISKQTTNNTYIYINQIISDDTHITQTLGSSIQN